MKLVEILASEMKEWPEGVTHLTQSNVDREIYNAQDGKDTDSLESLEPRFDAIKSHDERCKYPVVNRAQWQAERDRQKGGEWKRHRAGRNQPVNAGVRVEVKLRCGDIQQGNAHEFIWLHSECDVSANIMQYRVISQPQAEEVEVNVFVGKDVKIEYAYAQEGVEPEHLEWKTMGTAKIDSICDLGPTEAKTDQIDGPIKWRDTIIHCQAIIEDCEREIQRNVDLLDAEGLMMLADNKKAMQYYAPDVDMSDWRNWKVGDVVECLTDSYGDVYTKGQQYKVKSVNRDDFDVFDNYGETSSCRWCDSDCDGLKFVSRP